MEFALSIEEMAFALGHAGGAETAAGYLTAITGQLTEDNMTGRMTAASHSLLSRGYLTWDGGAARATMNADLQQVVNAFLTTRISLRTSSSRSAEEDVVTFFLDGPNPVKHQFVQSVTARLTVMPDSATVARDVATLMYEPVVAPSLHDGKLGAMAADTLRALRGHADASTAQRAAMLRKTLPEQVAAGIAADMEDDAAVWSTILRITTSVEGAAEANQGLFGVQTSKRGWLFAVLDDPTTVDVFALSMQQAYDLILRLCTWQEQ